MKHVLLAALLLAPVGCEGIGWSWEGAGTSAKSRAVEGAPSIVSGNPVELIIYGLGILVAGVVGGLTGKKMAKKSE